MASLHVPARFNGPPHSANGGWFAGRVAEEVDADVVTVRLRTPPPLDRDLAVLPASCAEGDAWGVQVWDGEPTAGSIVASAVPAAAEGLGDDVPPPVAFDVAQASGTAYEGLSDHPFPTCFTCGTARSDGLGLRPGRVPGGGGEYAATWVPVEVSGPIVWAALDCPSGWSAGVSGRPMLLGTMTARVVELPAVGERCVVVAWPRGSEGRRCPAASVLYGDDGRLLARAETIWVAVDPATVRPVA